MGKPHISVYTISKLSGETPRTIWNFIERLERSIGKIDSFYDENGKRLFNSGALIKAVGLYEQSLLKKQERGLRLISKMTESLEVATKKGVGDE